VLADIGDAAGNSSRVQQLCLIDLVELTNNLANARRRTPDHEQI
jgi:hypothetical protein